MKPEIIKTFLGVHTWTGLVAGLALFIAFYTGSITVFVHEIEAWESYTQEPLAHQDQNQAQELIDLFIAEHPEGSTAFRLYPSSKDHPGHSIYWFEQLEDKTFQSHKYLLSKEGELVVSADSAHLADFIYRLHYTAGLPTSFGLYVLGVICVIYGIALITGLIIFLPNWLKDLFQLRSTQNKKRFWLDAHNVVGVISLPWHFMFAWSSAVLTIGIFFLAPFQLLVFDDDLLDRFGSELGFPEASESSGETAKMMPVKDLLQVSENHFPGQALNQLRYTNYGDANASVSILGNVNSGTLTTNTNLILRARDGEIIDIIDPSKSGIGATIYNGLVSLHFANFGGHLVKWVYFSLGLAGAFLFYSGNLLWIETRRKRRQTMQQGTASLLAKLTTGVCIGCMAAVSAAFVATRIFTNLPNSAELTELVYCIVFLGSVLYAFFRPAASGGRDLLYCCALLSAFIPVVDILFVPSNVWVSALSDHWPLVVVDVLAIAFAIIFWKLGLAVDARAKAGELNSVWSEIPDEGGVIQVHIDLEKLPAGK